MQKKTCILYFTIILILAIFWVSTIGICLIFVKERVCNTTSCLHSAENLRFSMDKSVKPCDDFYEFACGNWSRDPNHKAGRDWFSVQKDVILANISRFLNQSDSLDDPKAVVKARKLYRSCIKQSKSENDDFTAIASILNKVDLPTIPFNESPFGKFSWMKTMVRSKAAVNLNFFINFGKLRDLKDHTILRSYISKPTGFSLLPGDEDRSFDPETFSKSMNISTEYMTTFTQYAKNVCQYVVQLDALDGKNWNDYEDEFNKIIFDVLEFNVLVDKATDDYYEKDTLIPSYININELQNMTDEITNTPIINWKEYFELLSKELENRTLDWKSDESVILMSDQGYFRQIFSLVASEKPQVIKFYMWMKIIEAVAPYTHKRLHKFKEDFDFTTTKNVQRPRDLYCADIVNRKFGMATAYSVINDDSMKQKISKVQIMVDDIINIFGNNNEDISWIDETTKNAAVKKIQVMKKLIGIPSWLNNTQDLDNFYDHIIVDENDFLGNILGKLNKNHGGIAINFDKEPWLANPMEVNAYNTLQLNAITIPVGILQFPFYDQGLEVLNYGAIGPVIGHEITHSFDNKGREYDEGGLVNPWWTNETKNEFGNRARCFIDYYGSFKVPGLEDKVNGLRTLSENIADDGGLKSSFIAYKKYRDEKGLEPKLKHFEDYSAEQLFFLSYANTWCENSSKYSSSRSAVNHHSPNKVRVVATLSNFKEFADAWRCELGSAMNPRRDKCQIW